MSREALRQIHEFAMWRPCAHDAYGSLKDNYSKSFGIILYNLSSILYRIKRYTPPWVYARLVVYIVYM